MSIKKYNGKDFQQYVESFIYKYNAAKLSRAKLILEFLEIKKIINNNTPKIKIIFVDLEKRLNANQLSITDSQLDSEELTYNDYFHLENVIECYLQLLEIIKQEFELFKIELKNPNNDILNQKKISDIRENIKLISENNMQQCAFNHLLFFGLKRIVPTVNPEYFISKIFNGEKKSLEMITLIFEKLEVDVKNIEQEITNINVNRKKPIEFDMFEQIQLDNKTNNAFFRLINLKLFKSKTHEDIFIIPLLAEYVDLNVQNIGRKLKILQYFMKLTPDIDLSLKDLFRMDEYLALNKQNDVKKDALLIIVNRYSNPKDR